MILRSGLPSRKNVRNLKLRKFGTIIVRMGGDVQLATCGSAYAASACELNHLVLVAAIDCSLTLGHCFSSRRVLLILKVLHDLSGFYKNKFQDLEYFGSCRISPFHQSSEQQTNWLILREDSTFPLHVSYMV